MATRVKWYHSLKFCNPWTSQRKLHVLVPWTFIIRLSHHSSDAPCVAGRHDPSIPFNRNKRLPWQTSVLCRSRSSKISRQIRSKMGPAEAQDHSEYPGSSKSQTKGTEIHIIWNSALATGVYFHLIILRTWRKFQFNKTSLNEIETRWPKSPDFFARQESKLPPTFWTFWRPTSHWKKLKLSWVLVKVGSVVD